MIDLKKDSTKFSFVESVKSGMFQFCNRSKMNWKKQVKKDCNNITRMILRKIL